MADKTIRFSIHDAEFEFSSLGSLRAWAHEEFVIWEPFMETIERLGIAGAPRELYRNFLTRMDSASEQATAEEVAALIAPFSTMPQFLVRGTKIGDQLLEMWGSFPEDTVAFAYAFAIGNAGLAAARNPAMLSGAMFVAFPWFAKEAFDAEAFVSERKAYIEGAQQLAKSVEAAEQLRAKEYAKAQRDQSDNFTKSQSRRTAANEASSREFANQRRTLVRLARRMGIAELRSYRKQATEDHSSLKAVEAAFREKIALQAPVQYWREKASEHVRVKKDRLAHLKWFFPATLIAVLVMFIAAAGGLLAADHFLKGTSNTVLVITGAGLATMTGLLLWIGRLLTKLYLSEHHLAHDAEERAVMTMTYLALTQERAADEKDRALVLAALFRNTSDGIVKDDAAPDISIAGLISKFGTGAK